MTSKITNKFAPEVCERAMRMVSGCSLSSRPGAIVVPTSALRQSTFRLGNFRGAGRQTAACARRDRRDRGDARAMPLTEGNDAETWSRVLQLTAKAATANLIDTGQPFGTVRHRHNVRCRPQSC